MKRPRPPPPSSGNSSGGNVGENRSIEFIVLLGISCLLLTYGVSTLRAVSNLPSPYHHETNTGSINSAPRSTNDAQNYDYSRQEPQLRLGQRVVSDGDDHSNHAAKHNERGMQVDANYDAQEQIDDGSDGATFPISTRSTEHHETIVHPASMIANNNSNRKNNQENMVYMKVPPFWEPKKFATAGGIRQHLGQYGERLITPQEAADVGSYVTASDGSSDRLETIYVAIASYRDWQCSATVENVFFRAKHPERIRVGVVDQVDEGDAKCGRPTIPCDRDPGQILCQYSGQIDVFEMDATLAVGPTYARHLGHRMYRGEYFAMQCDAHVQFVQNWDTDIIEQWKSAKNEMAVLTAYLSDVQGAIDPSTGERLHQSRPIMCRTDYEGWGDGRHLRHGQQPEGIPGIKGEPTLEPYWAAGFSFARGHFVLQVPYDQYLPMIFQGEEISMGLRGFTYGYDYYTPEKSVCFHMYAVGKNKSKRKKVKLFWEHSSLYSGVGSQAMNRLLGIILMNPACITPDKWLHEEEQKYGIGKVRSLQKFFDTFGIHTESQTVEQHLCRFVGKKMQNEFKPHLRSDAMGINYDKILFRFKDPAPDEKPPPLNGARL